MSVPNGIAAIGALGFDTVCGVVGVGSTYAKGGGFDYITIPNGQCAYPSTTGTAVPTVTADRYCGTSFKYKVKTKIEAKTLLLLPISAVQKQQRLREPQQILSVRIRSLLGFVSTLMQLSIPLRQQAKKAHLPTTEDLN